MKDDMFARLPVDQADRNWRILVKRREDEFQKARSRQVRKFDWLIKEMSVIADHRRLGFKDCVVNMSACELSEMELTLLSKGLKFVPSPKEVPVKDIITGVEEIASKLGSEKAEELRHETKRILKKYKNPVDNLTRLEKRAIGSLKAKADEIVILQADKGNKTVVMNKNDYEEKMQDALIKQKVQKIPKDLTDYESRKVVKVLKKIEELGELTRVERLRLTESAPRCPVVYGMPKLHKEGTPLRVIFSFCGSPTYLIARLMSKILQPLHGKSESFVRDSSHVCDVLKDLTLGSDEVLVSYDVVNLFGSVPAQEAVNMALARLEKDDGLKSRTNLSFESCGLLLKLCIESNYFKCNGTFYKTFTCPIGSPLSPALCSVFMEEFEMKTLRASAIIVRLWKRYVDDILAVVRKGEEELLLQCLNNGHPNIEFTFEKEEDGRICFLDIELSREEGGLRTCVFRKKSSTDRYLDFQSAHCNQIKWGVVSCLKNRAERVCNRDEDLQLEKERIRKVFVKNGYPSKEVKRRLVGTQKRKPNIEADRTFLRIPYVPGLEKEFKVLTKRLNIQVRYMRGRTLGQMVSGAKLDKVEDLERGGVVYRQRCGECKKVYIGETARRARERKREHERDVKQVSTRSAISEHCHVMKHRPDFDSFCVLDVEKNWRRRRIKESLHIMANETFNRDEGIGVDKRWRSLVKT
jgi:hypothetical protein